MAFYYSTAISKFQNWNPAFFGGKCECFVSKDIHMGSILIFHNLVMMTLETLQNKVFMILCFFK